MKANDKIAAIDAAFYRGGWLINTDRPPNDHAITAAHFDGMGSAVTLHVMSDMQGRISATLSVGGIGILLNERIMDAIDAINAVSRTGGI